MPDEEGHLLLRQHRRPVAVLVRGIPEPGDHLPRVAAEEVFAAGAQQLLAAAVDVRQAAVLVQREEPVGQPLGRFGRGEPATRVDEGAHQDPRGAGAAVHEVAPQLDRPVSGLPLAPGLVPHPEVPGPDPAAGQGVVPALPQFVQVVGADPGLHVRDGAAVVRPVDAQQFEGLVVRSAAVAVQVPVDEPDPDRAGGGGGQPDADRLVVVLDATGGGVRVRPGRGEAVEALLHGPLGGAQRELHRLRLHRYRCPGRRAQYDQDAHGLAAGPDGLVGGAEGVGQPGGEVREAHHGGTLVRQPQRLVAPVGLGHRQGTAHRHPPPAFEQRAGHSGDHREHERAPVAGAQIDQAAVAVEVPHGLHQRVRQGILDPARVSARAPAVSPVPAPATG
ncbi:hypothetical protein QFZ55_000385 [Streptomyces luteogriseus]|nr:hypothetical protein [Streptomyces luteogriseus]